MEISYYNKTKLSTLNSICILLVLLLHSYFVESADYSLAGAIQSLTGTNGISGVAVPLFFFISGLLFFKSVSAVNDCVKGVKKRIRTLLIPYLIWNLIFVGWYALMHFIPGISQFVNSDILGRITLDKPLDSLQFLFITPAAFQLWFLRDLMLFMLTTPVLYWLIKRYPIMTLLVLFLSLGWIPNCGIIYFCFGALVAMHVGLEIFSLHLTSPIIELCTLVFLCKCVMATIPSLSGIVQNPYIEQLTNMCGIVSVWGGYDRANSCKIHFSVRLKRILLCISSYSFFIYLFHEPVFNIIKKLSLMLLGVSNVSLILCYFINPLIMAIISIGVAYIIKNTLPKLYGILVGGR